MNAKYWLGPLLLATACSVSYAHALDMQEFKATISREDGGAHNEAFEPEFEALQKSFPRTKDPLGIDGREFLGAHRLIITRSQGDETGALLRSAKGLNVPAAMFSTFGRELARTFETRLGVSSDAAHLMAGLLEKQAVEAEGVSYSEYSHLTGRGLNLDANVVSKGLREALDFLYSTSKIGTGCEVPFIAGYAQDDERVVYIDRSVPEFRRFRNIEAPLHKLLNAHERVEKSILDEFGATYPHAHQIALRLEKAFADAIGVPWRPYDAYWGPVSETVYDHRLKRVPRRLEMTPYLSFTDADSIAMVQKMRVAYVSDDRCFRDQSRERSRHATFVPPGPRSAAERVKADR